MNCISTFVSWALFVDKENQTPPDKEPRWLVLMALICLAVILVLVIVAKSQYWLVENYVQKNGDDEVTRFGISGDFFGFANALFSALAFAMIIVTLWMQKHELQQQREELEITRDVLQQQHLEMKEQNESLRQQRFENTFFGMLRMHSEIVAAVKAYAGDFVRGRDAFAVLIPDLKATQKQPSTTTTRQVDVTVHSYETWYRDNEAEVGHYFRTLYNMIRYIHEKGGDERSMYARLVRAQLSSNELELLLYNGLCEHGKEKFKPLIEKYALLKHLKESPDLESWRAQYKPSAFG